MMVDHEGNEVWVKNFNEEESGLYGDFSSSCTKKTNDGGIIMGGEFYSLKYDSLIGGYNFKEESYLLKTDINGNKQWSKIYDDGSDYGIQDVSQLSNNSFVFFSHTNNQTIFTKTNSIGVEVLTLTLDLGESGYESVYHSYVNSQDNILVFWNGENGTNMTILSSDGNNLISKHYSGINGNHVEKINDNEFVITGDENSNLIIFKINSEGELIQ